jgi:hypothetical protein
MSRIGLCAALFGFLMVAVLFGGLAVIGIQTFPDGELAFAHIAQASGIGFCLVITFASVFGIIDALKTMCHGAKVEDEETAPLKTLPQKPML